LLCCVNSIINIRSSSSSSVVIGVVVLVLLTVFIIRRSWKKKVKLVSKNMYMFLGTTQT